MLRTNRHIEVMIEYLTSEVHYDSVFTSSCFVVLCGGALRYFIYLGVTLQGLHGGGDCSGKYKRVAVPKRAVVNPKCVVVTLSLCN